MRFCQAAYAMRVFVIVQLSVQFHEPRSSSHQLNCPPWPRVIGIVSPHPFSIDKRASGGQSPDGCVLRDHASGAELHAVGLPQLLTIVATGGGLLAGWTNLNCCGKTLERIVDGQVHFLVEDATASDDCFC